MPDINNTRVSFYYYYYYYYYNMFIVLKTRRGLYYYNNIIRTAAAAVELGGRMQHVDPRDKKVLYSCIIGNTEKSISSA